MKPLSLSVFATVLLLGGGPACAQNPNYMFGGSRFNPPLPPPPPPPRIEVPEIPQLDVPSRQNVPIVPRTSFGDRIVRCLEEAAAVGVRPADRAAYSRDCANR